MQSRITKALIAWQLLAMLMKQTQHVSRTRVRLWIKVTDSLCLKWNGVIWQALEDKQGCFYLSSRTELKRPSPHHLGHQEPCVGCGGYENDPQAGNLFYHPSLPVSTVLYPHHFAVVGLGWWSPDFLTTSSHQ